MADTASSINMESKPRQESGQSEERMSEQVHEATNRVKDDIERLVQGFDLQVISKRVEEFGRENPIGLAMTALTLGVAAGILMRGSRRAQSASSGS